MVQLVVSSYRQARRVAILVLGSTVLVVGLAMLVLPGPGTVVIPLGLGILAIEFAWARRWLQRLKSAAQELQARSGLSNSTHRPSVSASKRDPSDPAA